MKESPIIFNGDMVRAILAGRKTQTRRLMKPQPIFTPMHGENVHWQWGDVQGSGRIEGFTSRRQCDAPLGKIGDHLWVRECFSAWWSRDTGKRTHVLGYRADIDPADWDGFGVDDPWWLNAKWEPSIHMPRAFSRIALEITDVRVERLHSISEADAAAEGLKQSAIESFAKATVRPGAFAFRDLWMSVYSADSWESNPWVWAITFKRVQP